MRSFMVVFPDRDMVDPSLVVLGEEADGQVLVVDSINVGPFPDWEYIARRVMRLVIEHSKAALAVS